MHTREREEVGGRSWRWGVVVPCGVLLGWLLLGAWLLLLLLLLLLLGRGIHRVRGVRGILTLLSNCWAFDGHCCCITTTTATTTITTTTFWSRRANHLHSSSSRDPTCTHMLLSKQQFHTRTRGCCCGFAAGKRVAACSSYIDAVLSPQSSACAALKRNSTPSVTLWTCCCPVGPYGLRSANLHWRGEA